MRLSALALLSFLATVLSGCASGAGDPISMRDGLADARDAAGDWGEDPKLVGALSIEPFKHAEDRDEDGTLRGEFITHIDGNPGDGRAPGWLYAFVSSDGRCIFVALASGLGVLAEGWEECAEEDDAAVLPGDLLDSDDVADVLDDLAGWPKADDATTLTWGLWSEDGSAVWEVSSSNTTSSVSATVDAVTGEARLQAADDVDFETGPDAAEWEDETGSWQSSSATSAVPVLTAAMPLEVEIDVGEGAVMDISAATGTSLTNQARLTVTDGQGAAYLAEDLPAGTYTVSIAHPTVVLSVSMTVEATWMT